MWISILAFTIGLMFVTTNAQIQWSGYTWNVHTGPTAGPGENQLSADNVFVDNQNYLHLQITIDNGAPINAEVASTNKFTFGSFQWKVEGDIVHLDPATVLGLFTYGGASGSNEIDIEAALWGRTEPDAHNLAYTIYPADQKDALRNVSNGYQIPSEVQGTYTTHRFEWSAEQVSLKSLYGHTDDPNDPNVIFSWTTPPEFTPIMPVLPAPIYMNLWSFNKKLPDNGLPVEFIVHEFKYTPAESKKKRMQYHRRYTDNSRSKSQQRRQFKHDFLTWLSSISK